MMRRVRPAAGIDRMEQKPANFYEAVSTAYRELAAREPNRIRMIDADDRLNRSKRKSGMSFRPASAISHG